MFRNAPACALPILAGAVLTVASTAAASARDSMSPASAPDPDAGTWLVPMVGYAAGYSQVGQEYNSSSTILEGPVLGAEIDVKKLAYIVGAEVRFPLILGLANPAVLPYVGIVLGYQASPKIRVSLGLGVEKLVMKSPTVGTPEGAPVRAEFGYRLESGNYLLAELAYRQYSFDNGVVTSAFPYFSYQVGISFPLRLSSESKHETRHF